MSKASPLGIRLFLEGHEVPVISAQVTMSPNRAAVASIQVIPSGMGLHLLPRTLVHLFFLDDISFVQKGNLKPGEAMAEDAAKIDASVVGSSTLNRISADDADYKMMFCGEVIGFNYSKTPTGRQLVLQCMDLSSYWDACYQWFADYSPGGTALTDKSHMFVGAGEGLFDNVASGSKWVLGRLLSTSPRTPEYQRAKGLLGGLIHLMEAVGGLRYRNGLGGTHGVNDFFTIAELRYNLLGQIGALEADTTSSKLYNSKAFFDWLRSGMTSLGNLISFRDVINHVNKYIFHEVYPNTCPRYLASSEVEGARNFQKADSTTLEDDETFGSAALQAMRDTKTILNTASFKFKSASLGLTAGQRQGPFTEGVSFLRQASKKRDVAEDWVDKSFASDASSVKSKLTEVGSKIDEALKETSGQTSDLGNRANKALSLSDEAQSILSSLTDLEHRSKNTAPRNTPVQEHGDRLFTQLFLPDCFFAAPPRCNVIFPDEYFSFNFSRNFLREVTRLSCQGGLGIIGAGNKRGASILGRHYFAPNVRDAAGRNLRVTLQYGGRVLLRHETHSGIIPKFSWVTQGHRWGVKAANKTGAVKIGNKISYVQRLANFQFFLHRWSSRSLNVSCVFKPTLVLGLPALVIDKPLLLSGAVQAAYGEALGTAFIPPQFLGKVAQLDHNITQSGGQTTVVLSHCRLHQGLDDELVGMLYEEKFSEKTIKEIDADYKKMAEDPNYKRGERTELSRVLRRYLDGKIKEGRPLRNEGVIRTVRAGTDITIRGAQVANLALPTRLTEGARVTVPKTLYVKVAQKIGSGQFIRKEGATIEDSLMPGWFSDDIWHRDNVGTKVYQFLLGCYSITDEMPVTTQELQERFKNLRDTGVDVGGAAASTWEAARIGDSSVAFLEAAGNSLAGVVEGSIEEAVNAIASIYGEIRSNKHYNVHEFIRNFTYRPIATLVDVLGSADLEFGDNGTPKEDTMVEGFHSRAFGDYNTEVKRPTKEGYKTEAGEDALFLLFRGKSKSEIANIKMGSMLDRSEPGWSLRPDFDPRGRALSRVKAYAAEMKVTRGLIG
jgi:hypothetical protein